MKSGTKSNFSQNGIMKIVMWIYLFMMFGIFPLFYDPYMKYYSIGTSKYNFYKYVSIFFFILLTVLFLFSLISDYIKRSGTSHTGIIDISAVRDFLVNLSILDRLFISFFILNIITFIIAKDKKMAFYGAKGWNMGLLTIILMLCGFVFTSVYLSNIRLLVCITAICSGLVYFFGILHRFYIDPLGMYSGIDAKYIKQFMSTIGQTTWYSSFLCILYPMGMTFYIIDSNKKRRVVAGIYCVISFCTMITQNSDSAFASLFVVMMIMLWAILENRIYIKRYAQMCLLIGISFAIMGLARSVFYENCVKLDRLTNVLSQSVIPYIWIALSCAFLFLTNRLQKTNDDWYKRIARKIKRILWVLLLILVIVAIIFIVLNSCGVLNNIFGVTINNNYLYFDDEWGNNRGFNWKFSLNMYKEMPIVNKLFGVGQDSFGAYAYSVDKYAAILRQKWGKEYLLCAHNAMLNYLICNGLIGAINVLLIILTGIRIGIKKMAGITNLHGDDNSAFYTITICGISLCIISICAHNFFCYSQVVCTPYLYIMLGIINNYMKPDSKLKICI